MFGIYAYQGGLKFTGKIAPTREAAEKYLSNKYGKVLPTFTGKYDVDGYPIYAETFVPGYNKEAFVIEELEIVE